MLWFSSGVFGTPVQMDKKCSSTSISIDVLIYIYIFFHRFRLRVSEFHLGSALCLTISLSWWKSLNLRLTYSNPKINPHFFFKAIFPPQKWDFPLPLSWRKPRKRCKTRWMVASKHWRCLQQGPACWDDGDSSLKQWRLKLKSEKRRGELRENGDWTSKHEGFSEEDSRRYVEPSVFQPGFENQLHIIWSVRFWMLKKGPHRHVRLLEVGSWGIFPEISMRSMELWSPSTKLT